MKVIDEKGRFFGKINIIDLLVILLAVAALLLVGWKIMGNRGADIGETSTLTYVTRSNGIDRQVYEEICKFVNKSEGKKDQLMANGELLDGYVVDVSAIPHVTYNSDAQGQTITSTETGADERLDLFFTIEAQIDNPIINKVGTQEVRTGKSHIVKTVNFELGYTLIYSCSVDEKAE